ncbi:acyl-CoA dehydrogenase [Nevskia soli]|uniref:acyl-CoA dehydrogenase n=1 Tax=Nevskia soli TaxID=418856 RepID=UPI0004A6FF17|nr:acyl-CoA dehydrogenase [Nevskia soli]
MFGLLMNWMKANKILPQISDTERQALEAGKVWIDGGFFAGKPDFRKILAENYNKLSAEEQAFLDGPVEELCRMVDRYDIGRTKQMPEEILAFIKKSGMMGFLIPKQYGGKQFSILGISTIMAKIGPVSATVGTFVVIPNSLGAAELIIHYGTQEQKDSYLPKLAAGEYVPCFGLTEPTAGSDAASIKAEGLVFKDSDGETKIKLNFRKRYITLAPIANLATIACRLHDPQNLLGKGEDVGITCVLVHQGTPGFTNGDHHDPIGDPFYNGPLIGKDVVVPVKNIIGAEKGAGQGWRMLMEQLAGGRMVSLPAGAVGGAKAVAAVTGPYSMVRQQFGISIGRMEGIEEKIGKIAALTYMLDGARVFGCSAVDSGIQPPVVSAIMKAYTTDLARELTADGMDVFSGSGVMQGPNNILGMGYKSAPVGITVEGANIMTRTLMVFGQGATRCHPYALKVVQGVEENNVALFRKNLVGWIGHFILNILRSWVHYLTRGLTAGSPVSGPTARYYRLMSWSATRFAVLTDLAMFTIGGKLKVRGKLTGRYSDALAWMILATGALRRFEAEGRKQEDLPLVHYSVQYALARVQEAFAGIYANFGGGLLGFWLRTVGTLFLRINPVGHLPGDKLGNQAALAIQSPSEQYRRLTNGVFISPDESLGTGRLIKAFKLLAQAEPVLAKIHAAQKNKQLPRGAAEELAQDAANQSIISAEEAALLRKASAARLEAIEVDVFTPEQYFGVVAKNGGLQLGEAPQLKRAANG